MQMTLEEGDNKQQNSDCHYEALTVCQVLCRQLDNMSSSSPHKHL